MPGDSRLSLPTRNHHSGHELQRTQTTHTGFLPQHLLETNGTEMITRRAAATPCRRRAGVVQRRSLSPPSKRTRRDAPWGLNCTLSGVWVAQTVRPASIRFAAPTPGSS